MKIAVLFDEENQHQEADLMKKMKLVHDFSYCGYTIKSKKLNRQLLNIERTDLFVILVGPSTRFLSSQFIDDLKLIINSTKTILCLNLEGMIGLDENHCPKILWDCGALQTPFGEENFIYLLNVMKLEDRKAIRTGSFHIRKDPRPYDME